MTTIRTAGWQATKSSIERAILNTPIERAVRKAWWMARSIARPRLRTVIRHDRLLEAAIHRAVGPNSTCVDIGANKGHVLAMMLRAAPNGRHIACEPIPELAKFVQQRFPSVTVHNLALSDRAGTSTFYQVAKNHGRSGLIRHDYPDHDNAQEITVTVNTLDSLNVGRVDLIKIDVEGAELGVLRGARETLKHKPTVIFEFIPPMSLSFGTTPEAIFDELHGYELYELSDWIAGRSALSREDFCKHPGGDFVAT